MLRAIIFLFSFTILSLLYSCEDKKASIKGVWKIHYKYDGSNETTMAVTFHSDHSFAYRVNDEVANGVWTIKDSQLELEYSGNSIWKGTFNTLTNEIRSGRIECSQYGKGSWYGDKIE